MVKVCLLNANVIYNIFKLTYDNLNTPKPAIIQNNILVKFKSAINKNIIINETNNPFLNLALNNFLHLLHHRI